jgi:uncharacterized coiled-coil DUF342 family protein
MSELTQTLKTLRDAAAKKRDAIEAQTKPLYAKVDALRAKIDPLNAELREVNKQIIAIERPALTDVSRDLYTLDVALSDATKTTRRTLANEGEAAPPTA